MGDRRDAYRVLVGKPDEERPLRKPRLSWVFSFKMDILAVGLD
jgi:hypothetical protein